MERQPLHTSWAGTIQKRFNVEELFAAEAQARGLIAHPGWAVLSDLVAERRAKLVGQMVGQTVLEQTEYVAKANSVRSFDEVMQAMLVLLTVADETRQRIAGGAGRQENDGG